MADRVFFQEEDLGAREQEGAFGGAASPCSAWLRRAHLAGLHVQRDAHGRRLLGLSTLLRRGERRVPDLLLTRIENLMRLEEISS